MRARLIEGDHSNVRIIRLAAEQCRPASSDVMLFVVDGHGDLDTVTGGVPIAAGQLACCRGDEELKVRNSGTTEMTLLAFLSPKPRQRLGRSGEGRKHVNSGGD